MADITIRDVLDCELGFGDAARCYVWANISAPDLRWLDHVEETTGMKLRDVFNGSTFAHVVIGDTGVPIGLFGILPGNHEAEGKVWAVGTKAFSRHADAIGATARTVFDGLLEHRYASLWNTFASDRPRIVRFLKEAGFSRVSVIPSLPGKCVQLYARFSA